MKRRLLLAVPLVLVVAATVLAVSLVRVHAEYGEWSLSPSATPPQLTYQGRHYHLATTAAALDPRDVVMGRAAGGELYGRADPASVPTVLRLRTGTTVAQYALAGGP